MCPAQREGGIDHSSQTSPTQLWGCTPLLTDPVAARPPSLTAGPKSGVHNGQTKTVSSITRSLGLPGWLFEVLSPAGTSGKFFPPPTPTPLGLAPSKEAIKHRCNANSNSKETKQVSDTKGWCL